MNTTLDRRLTPARPDLAARHLQGLVEARAFVDPEPMRVAASSAPLRREPRPDAPLDTEALCGEAVDVYERFEGWAWVQLRSDGYVGYVPDDALRPDALAPTHRVGALRTFVYPGPSMKLPPLAALSLGAGVAVAGESAHVPRRIKDFLRRAALEDLEAAVARHTAALGIPARRITIRDTTSRWGSCSSQGHLNFSWRLILAPPLVLDYLAAHEVAHLKEMNHSHRFWALTHKLCPRTEEAEAWLKRHGAGLHAYG